MLDQGRSLVLLPAAVALAACAGASSARPGVETIVAAAVTPPAIVAPQPQRSSGLIPAVEGPQRLNQAELGRPDPFGSVMPPPLAATVPGSAGQPGTPITGTATPVLAPPILTGVLDSGGQRRAIVQLSSGASTTVGVGDRLPNGWQVVAIDSRGPQPTVWFRAPRTGRPIASRMAIAGLR